MPQMSILVLAVLAPLLAAGAVVEHWWNITFVNANPDGQFARQVVGVNGQWPPPPIEITTQDTLVVHATNQLNAPTTLHHHGMPFNRTTFFDGVPQTTQCGIPPGESFTYVIELNNQTWGTYWVHGHDNGNYVDGLRAPFIIHKTPEAFTYDDEFTVVMGDWYHQQHSVLLSQFLSPADPGGNEPVPDSSLVYFTHKGAYLPSSKNPAAVGINENATLPFQPGKTYRLRLINMSAFATFYFKLDGHEMRIIEVDGTDVEPFLMTDALSIAVAQRYSVLVTAHNSTSQNFAVIANMDESMFNNPPASLNPNNTLATVVYSPHARVVSPSLIQSYTLFNESMLAPVNVIPQFEKPSTLVNLVAEFSTMTDGTNHGMFNNVTYNQPIVPTFFTALTIGSRFVDNPLVYGTQSFILNHLDVVQILITNLDTGPHPFHVHGHKFQVVNKSMNITSTDPVVNPPLVEQQANPVRRDTIIVPSLGSTTLRLVADNPGAWLLHCHIEWHLQSGLAVTLVEAPVQMPQVVHPPSFIGQQCAAQAIPSSGNAAGHPGLNLTGLPVGPFPVSS